MLEQSNFEVLKKVSEKVSARVSTFQFWFSMCRIRVSDFLGVSERVSQFLTLDCAPEKKVSGIRLLALTRPPDVLGKVPQWSWKGRSMVLERSHILTRASRCYVFLVCVVLQKCAGRTCSLMR